MTSTRPVKAIATCLLAAGSIAVSGPAFAGTSTPPSVPGSSVPGGGANATLDLGVAAPTPELIADFQAPGMEDPAAVFAQYGFGDVPVFPLIANSVLYQVMGNHDLPPGQESGSHSLTAYFVVTATDADLQRIVDAVVAGLMTDPALYEVSAGNGTDDTIKYVTADITAVDYGTLPSWTVDVFTDTAEPGPTMIQIDYDATVEAAVPLPPQLATAHAGDISALAAAGLTGTGYSFTVGVNEFGGFPIDTNGLTFYAAGTTFDAAATTACTALGFTAAVSEYDDESWTCASPDGVEPSISVDARTSPYNDADAKVTVDYSA